MKIHRYKHHQYGNPGHRFLPQPTPAFRSTEEATDPMDDLDNQVLADLHSAKVDEARQVLKSALRSYLAVVAARENFYMGLVTLDDGFQIPDIGALNVAVEKTLDKHYWTMTSLAENLLKSNTEDGYFDAYETPEAPETGIEPYGDDGFTSGTRPVGRRRPPERSLRSRTRFLTAQAKEASNAQSLVAQNYDKVLRTAQSVARNYVLPESLSEDMESQA